MAENSVVSKVTARMYETLYYKLEQISIEIVRLFESPHDHLKYTLLDRAVE